jgi:hypothetical protein
MSSSDTLKGRFNFGEFSFEDILQANVISFFDWGFINKEGFTNVSIPTSGAYGGQHHKLFYVQDERYTNGQVWQAFRGNWVWESGLYTSRQPVSISGIFVNGSFVGNSGLYSVDYNRGRIVFDTAISTTSTVQLAYTYKAVNVVSAEDIPIYNTVDARSHRWDEFASGTNARIIDTNLQLPLVGVELGRHNYRPYQMGGDSIVTVNVILHVIAEDEYMIKTISNMISSQKEKTLITFDLNTMAEQNRFPLTYEGDIAPSALVYPQLTEAFRATEMFQHGNIRIVGNARVGQISRIGSFYTRDVSLDVEAILLGI